MTESKGNYHPLQGVRVELDIYTAIPCATASSPCNDCIRRSDSRPSCSHTCCPKDGNPAASAAAAVTAEVSQQGSRMNQPGNGGNGAPAFLPPGFPASVGDGTPGWTPPPSPDVSCPLNRNWPPSQRHTSTSTDKGVEEGGGPGEGGGRWRTSPFLSDPRSSAITVGDDGP